MPPAMSEIRVVFETEIKGEGNLEYSFQDILCTRPHLGELVKPLNSDDALMIKHITHCYGDIGSDKNIPYLKIKLSHRI